MAHVSMQDLEPFIDQPVRVCIHGERGEEMAPWVNKRVKKLEWCPERTHLRIFFDHHYFFAVPLSSDVRLTKSEWCAYDKQVGLYYVMRNEENEYV